MPAPQSTTKETDPTLLGGSVLADQKTKAHSLQSGAAYRVAKRAFDVCFSLGVLTAFAIPGALLGAAISLESPGGPLFRQRRIGKNGKEIRIFKFRSMYSDAHDHPEKYLNEAQMMQWKREQKVDDDPRVTRIGKVIRKTSLDEIPQFINVLAGDMSVIGPRPVTIAETYEFGDSRDKVLLVRPGITGWWQVTDRNDATWKNGKRQQLELWYVDSASLKVDALIFVKTFGAMFGRNRSGR